MVRRVSGRRSRISVLGAMGFAATLSAQTASITGTVVDQVAKAIPGATVTAKSEAGAVGVQTTTDNEGRFSINGLAAGNDTVEASEPGFALSVRRGVQAGGGVIPDLSITMNVDSISQSVTVQESVSLAVDLAPQGNTLDATSARTEITPTVIQNFMAPVADSPRSFSRLRTRSASTPMESDSDRASPSSAVSRTVNTRLLSTVSRSKTPTARPTTRGPVSPASGSVRQTSIAAPVRRTISGQPTLVDRST